MSQAYKCDRCKKLFEINLITHENKQKYSLTRSEGDFQFKFDLCGSCQKAFEAFLDEKTFSPHEVNIALVIHGQSDLRFKLGETIKYSPSEVEEILEGENKNG